MITLSDLEKDFLKRIVDLSEKTQNMFLGNLLEIDLQNVDVYLDRQKNLVEFHFDVLYFPQNTDFIYKVREMSLTFMKLVKLLKYLEKENYLYLYQESKPDDNFRFGRLIQNSPCIIFQLYDPDIKKLLIDYSHRTIVVGQTVIDYVKNNFQTLEQIRHNENIRIAEQNLKIANESLEKAEIGITQSKKSINRATTAIFVSILLGFISILSSFYLSEKQSARPISIEKNQFESLNENIKSVDSSLVNLRVLSTSRKEKVNIIK